MSKKRRPEPPQAPKPTMKKLTYRGYTVVQSAQNHHVMIGKNGKRVFHGQADHSMTDDELREYVDNYITLVGKLGVSK